MKTAIMILLAAMLMGCATTGYKNVPEGRTEATSIFQCKDVCGAYDAYAPARHRTHQCVNDCMRALGFSN